ncbi:MAG: dihydroorotate dehydrogenase [Planctomycetota bacterium]|jgi:dihydroorotate dehydrogenase (NAD+) catalytic subunit
MTGQGGFDLSVDVGGLRMANPVTVGSGTYGMGMEMARIAEVGDLGAVVLKSLTLEPRTGNPVPRVAETPAGMLNAIGLENPGVDAFLSTYLEQVRRVVSCPLVANIAGYRAEEYVELARRLSAAEGVAALEVNVSCPNVGAGGLVFGTDPERLRGLVAEVRAETELPLWVKLSPNVTDIVACAQAALEGGADALTLINTLLGMEIDVEKRRPVLANVTGGLSGPAIRPVALRMVRQVYEATGAPIVGLGGISSTEDAMKFILAGATAVSIGTMNFVRPEWSAELPAQMAERGAQLGAKSVRERVGTLDTTP